MATKTSKGRASIQRAKDQARAADLRARGVVRTTCRCPICHRTVDLKHLPDHVGSCGGR